MVSGNVSRKPIVLGVTTVVACRLFLGLLDFKHIPTRGCSAHVCSTHWHLGTPGTGQTMPGALAAERAQTEESLA